MNGLIFDLDGTLIDSAPDIQAAVNKMLAEEGISPLDLATVISFIGNGMPKLVPMIKTHTHTHTRTRTHATNPDR